MDLSSTIDTIGAVIEGAAGLSNQQKPSKNPTLNDFQKSQPKVSSKKGSQSSRKGPRNDYQNPAKAGSSNRRLSTSPHESHSRELDPLNSANQRAKTGAMRMAAGEPIKLKDTPNPERFAPPPDMDFSVLKRDRGSSRDPYDHRWRREETAGDQAVAFLQQQRADDTKKAYEERGYHDEGGNINRDYFNEIMDQHRLQTTTARSQILDAVGSKISTDSRADAQSQEISKLKKYLNTMRSVLTDAGGFPAAMAGLSIDELAELSKPGSDEIVRPASWKPEDFAKTAAHPSVKAARAWRRADHPRMEDCLRDDVQGQLLEIRTEMLLSKVKVAMLSRDWAAMRSHIADARRVSEKLGYAPLDAVISFYLAIAQYSLGEFEHAKQSINLAGVAKGHYREGEQIEKWRKRIAKGQEQAEVSLPSKMQPQGGVTLWDREYYSPSETSQGAQGD